ncbi:MAG: VOC family protein [Planctomycetes bacterium]|nr:VOC family protein [Planctomycetota bacterium]
MDHVALLVANVEAVVARLDALGLSAGPIEEFPAEGTREAYAGAPDCSARLLLMQPMGTEGPYARAFAARGPGLHHVAVNVPALEKHIAHVRGWLLHPRSLESITKCRTAWLARPGVGTLLEIRDAAPVGGPPMVQAIEVPVEPGLEPLLEPYGLLPSSDRRAHLVLAGRRFEATQLAG